MHGLALSGFGVHEFVHVMHGFALKTFTYICCAPICTNVYAKRTMKNKMQDKKECCAINSNCPSNGE